jgi:hypothetical protein
LRLPWAAVLLAGALPAAAGTPVEEAKVHATIQDIVAGAEYRRLRGAGEAERAEATRAAAATEPAQRERPRRSEGRGGGRGDGAAAGAVLASVGGVLRVLVYAALAAAVVGVLFLLAQRLRGPSSTASALPAPGGRISDDPAITTPGDRPSDEFLRQALAEARAGRHRESIRLLLMGALSFIERRGLIRHRQGLTNRDYLRSVAREPQLRGGLEPIVTAFDEVYFGRRGATPDRFDECLRHYRSAFGDGA